jgi:hypothetical protein
MSPSRSGFKAVTAQGVLTLHRDYNFNSTISVLVGDKQEPFTVHRDLICDSSKFFKAACSQHWVEGREKEVRLPAVMPWDFQRYLAWLYSKKLEAASKGLRDIVVYATIDLYILGDVLDDIRLRNAAVAFLFGLEYSPEKGLPGFPTVEKMWAQTPPNSSLRNMYVAKFVRHMSAGFFEEKIAEYPMEFVQEIAVAALRSRDDIGGFGAKLDSFLEPVPEDD